MDTFLNACVSAWLPPSNAAVQGESGGQTRVHMCDLDDVGELQDRQHGRFIRQYLESEEVASVSRSGPDRSFLKIGGNWQPQLVFFTPESAQPQLDLKRPVHIGFFQFKDRS